jgi:peptidoglycan/xylan/chitin deacetylase (PgdA/CDA1 family)
VARLGRPRMPEPIVLCYHALSPTWAADLSISPDRFERHIRLLLRRGYRGVRFSEAVQNEAGEKAFAVTFDDAYRSVAALAAPILARLGVPATVFVPTDYIGSEAPMEWPGIDRWMGGPFARELTPMSWGEIEELATAGWEIGSHTASHPHLTEIDDLALARELDRSKAECEKHVPGECASVAYPYGHVDARVVAAAAAAGYRTGAALPVRLEPRGALEWPRIGVYRIDADLRFRLKVSPAVMALRRSGAWNAVARARRATVVGMTPPGQGDGARS